MRKRIGWFVALAVICAMAVGFTSCGGKSSKKKKKPTILAVNPTSGPVAGGTTVTIDTKRFKSDFMVNPPLVTFNMVPATGVTGVDVDTITADTPPGPVTGGLVDVQVIAQNGKVGRLASAFFYDTGSSSGCTITSVNPTQGDVAGGTSVLITGVGFENDPATVITFGGVQATNFQFFSSNQIGCDTPANGAGIVDVVVTSTSVSCNIPSAYTYTQSAGCTITQVLPDNGSTNGGTLVWIDGTSFETNPKPIVTFGANAVDPAFVQPMSTTRIRVDSTPASVTPGWVDVSVTTTTSSCTFPASFRYDQPPPPPTCTITGINPTSGPDFGGNSLQILGSGFTASSTVHLGGSPVAANYVSATEMLIPNVPAGVGAVDVMVDILVNTCTAPMQYSYISCQGPGCQLSNVSPGSGSVGDTVTINGNSFEAGALVFFGNAPNLVAATVLSVTPTAIQVIVPPPQGAGGTVDVEVINPSGACCNRKNAFDYTGVSCVITDISRTAGPDTGGSSVVINGSGFENGAVAYFGTELCPTNVWMDAGTLAVMTPPANGQSTVDVTVVNPSGGSCVLPSAFTFGGCTITNFTPTTSGTNGGATMTIDGFGFDPFSLKVSFGNIYVNVADVTWTPTQIILKVPPSPVGGPVTMDVFNETLASHCTETFTYVLPGASACTITDIQPDTGSQGGDTFVTISGTGFDANTGVIFSQMAARDVQYNAGTGDITCYTPPYAGPMAQPPIPVDVIVCPEFSDPCSRTNGFTYAQPSCPGGCNISGLSPATGSVAGGNTVTVSGGGFCAEGPAVYFGNNPGTVTYISATQLDVVVPPSTTGAGTVDVYYYDNSGCFTPPPLRTYTYN